MVIVEITMHFNLNPQQLKESFPEGAPRGALTEVFGALGSGKTEVVLQWIASTSGSRIAWVEKDFTIYPIAFPQQGVSLERVLFVDGLGSEELTLWSAYQILRSQIFGFVVVSASVQDEVSLRRLQLAAEKAQASVILITHGSVSLSASWPISIRIQVSRFSKSYEDEVDLRILKNRRRQCQAISV